jgi:hypothetical protein
MWPNATIEREVPVAGRIGHQRLSGRIDMLVTHPRGSVLIDQKTLPGGHDRWPEYAGNGRASMRRAG